jgi:flagellar hook assembly protein FlgD
MPKTFALEQNYPNPFNPSTKISYALPVQSVVTLKIFNVLGQEVATLFNGAAAAGSYDIVWNGKDNSGKSVASGVYLYKLQANAGSTEFSQVRKMVLMK